MCTIFYINHLLAHTKCFQAFELCITRLVGTAEYADCFSTEKTFPIDFPGYDIKPSDGEASVLILSGRCRTHLLQLLQIETDRCSIGWGPI